MRGPVFVTGATGVLGRPVLMRLVAAGREVRALARSAANEERLRELGARAVRGELFEPRSYRAALEGCEAVLHLATRIPPLRRAARRSAWRENDRIRGEGTRALVEAALAARAEAFVYPSVGFGYPDRGSEWIDAATPFTSPCPPILASTLEAEREVERFARSGGRGIALRMGYFYGLDAESTRTALALARRGFALLPGEDEGYVSQIWIDDAAEAVAAALDGVPSGVFDAVEDEPSTNAELRDALASAAGRARLASPPRWLLRLLAGRTLSFAARSQRVSNARFREASAWRPEVPNAREGLLRAARALADRAPGGRIPPFRGSSS